jgi:hypothetical protein
MEAPAAAAAAGASSSAAAAAVVVGAAHAPRGASTSQADDPGLIRDGDYVVFDEHGEKMSLVVIKPNG